MTTNTKHQALMSRKRKNRMSSILDTYTIYSPIETTKKRLFVSVTSYGIIFSTNTVKALKNTSRVDVYFNTEKKQMALKSNNATCQWNFIPNKSNKYVRWNNYKLKNTMESIAGFELDGNRYQGRYYRDENIIIFDFNKSKPVRTRRSNKS